MRNRHFVFVWLAALALLSGPATAATIVVNGAPDPGAAGADGLDSAEQATAGGDGAAGGGGAASVDFATSGDPVNTAEATGGDGGAGGSGGRGLAEFSRGGNGGGGGAGGPATADAASRIEIDFPPDAPLPEEMLASAIARAKGGSGGAGGDGGAAVGSASLAGAGGKGGDGGEASASAGADLPSYMFFRADTDATAQAVGGDGGDGGRPGAAQGVPSGHGGGGGSGGAAEASGRASSLALPDGGHVAAVTLESAGGRGGIGYGVDQFGGGGGAARADAEAGNGGIIASEAIGGGGGDGLLGARGGDGGSAVSTGSASNARNEYGDATASQAARGGDGGNSDGGRGGDGGAANVVANSFALGASSNAVARGGGGGDGGAGGHGGAANVKAVGETAYGGAFGYATVIVEAAGGSGGGATAGDAGDGGGASGTASVGSYKGTGRVSAIGGAGGLSASENAGGAGGEAMASIQFAARPNSGGSNVDNSGDAYAQGGAGGSGRHGGDATAIITSDYDQIISYSSQLRATAIGGAAGPGPNAEQGDALASVVTPLSLDLSGVYDLTATANGRQARASILASGRGTQAVDADSSRSGVTARAASVLDTTLIFSEQVISSETRATVGHAAPSASDLAGVTMATVAIGLPTPADVDALLDNHSTVQAVFGDDAAVLGRSMFGGEPAYLKGTTRTDFVVRREALPGAWEGGHLLIGLLDAVQPEFPEGWLLGTVFTIAVNDHTFTYDFSPQSEEEVEEKRRQADAFFNDNVIDLGPWQPFLSADGLLNVSFSPGLHPESAYYFDTIFGVGAAPSFVVPLPGTAGLFATALAVLFISATRRRAP